jgi:hypothetical protein
MFSRSTMAIKAQAAFQAVNARIYTRLPSRNIECSLAFWELSARRMRGEDSQEAQTQRFSFPGANMQETLAS